MSLVLGLVVVAGGCGDSGEPVATVAGGGVAISDVVDDVDYYIACANEPVTVDGVRWYPVPDWGNATTAALYRRITSVDREDPVRRAPIGFAPRVAPPGPGDDVGALFVYDDGYAWFESDSGLSIWLTQDELAYTWIC